MAKKRKSVAAAEAVQPEQQTKQQKVQGPKVQEKAQEDENGPSTSGSRNKEKVLIVSSRGITFR